MAEAFRRRAIRQLQQEQENRAARLRTLKEEATNIEREDLASAERLERAKEAVPPGACPRCWIWDGERQQLDALAESDGVGFFKCGQCGETIEAALR